MTDTTGAAGPRLRGRWLAFALTLVMLAIVLALIWGGTTTPDEPQAPVADAAARPATLAETMGEEGTLRIEIVALNRLSPGTLELRMIVTNVSQGATALDIAQRFSADGPDRGTIAEVYLADLGHQRKLFILRDAEGVPIGSRDERPLAPGEGREVWAHYPSPGEAEEAVVVHVPHAEPMPNVPVGQAAPTPPQG